MTTQATETLREYYGMSGAELVPTELGAINDNFFVDWNGGRYVLKRYRPGDNSPERVTTVCRVQRELRTAGIPAPELVLNTAGQAVTEAGGTCFVLSRRAPGRHYSRGEVPAPVAESLGRVLGQIVTLLAARWPIERYLLPDPAAAIAATEELLRKAQAGTEQVDAVARAVLSYRLAALQRLAPLYPRLAALPLQWVHGDYQLTNVLIDESGQIAAVLDFDNLRCRPRGQEFMRALDLCFDREPDGLSQEALAFFRGYAEVVRPSPEETSLYAALRAYGAHSSWPIAARYLEPKTYQPRWDRFITPPSDWWERNMDAVSGQLLAELTALGAGTAASGPNHRISGEVL